MPINKPTKHIYKAANGEWAWRIRASNGQIVAIGGETFVTKSGAETAFMTALRNTLVLASEIVRPDANGSD